MSNKRIYDITQFYLTSKKNLISKYNSFENSYTLICINNLIYTENCHIVARFKDFLYYDDDTEFLNKFFGKNEQKKILSKVFHFYSKYCKVFPNYMILPENEFLYRNLRKKQKLIDQFNEIKKEEEENRKHLKLNKKNENNYIIFGKKEQESIDKYKPSFTQSTIMMDYLNFNYNNDKGKSSSKILNDINNSKNSITISLNYNNNNFDIDDFNNSELTLISIANLINKTPTKTEKNNSNKNEDNKLSYTPPKSKTKTEKFNIVQGKGANNITIDMKKKYISYYQNKKNGNSKHFSNNIKINNMNNSNNNNTNISNKGNNHKKEILTSKKNSINSNNIIISSNINTQGKASSNILISSITKTSKGKDGKNIYKNIKPAIAKKKLFTTTEKTITHKKPIFNYQNKKQEKTSNSINNNKHKKNFKDMISISIKPSISPPGTKINSLKLKIIDNLIKNQNGTKIINIKSTSVNNSNSNSYVIKTNKNIKPYQINHNENIEKEKNENEKIYINLDKKNAGKNPSTKKITVKEVMKNYKNILKMDKTNHFSHDINKNEIIMNKNTFSNFTDKISFKNTSNDKIRKTVQGMKNISPSTKKYAISNNKNIKTPVKPDARLTENNFKKNILNTKEASQVKIQNYIKKILDKNNTKKENVTNKSKLK